MTKHAFLDAIVAAKREELPRRLQKEPLEALKRRIARLDEQQEGRGELWSLRRAVLEGPRGPLGGGKRIHLVGEIKKAVPGKGRIIDEFTRQALPRAYTHSGITAIAIHTESKHYMGAVDHLEEARRVLDGYYPGGRPSLWRRDFLFDPYHIWETRAFGADAVSLLPSILSDDELRTLTALAGELGLECVLEAHDEDDVRRALAANADIVCINNRDWGAPEADLATTERLRPLIPVEKVVLSSGGVGSVDDVERLAACGVHAVVVGEALMLASDVKRMARGLLI